MRTAKFKCRHKYGRRLVFNTISYGAWEQYEFLVPDDDMDMDEIEDCVLAFAEVMISPPNYSVSYCGFESHLLSVSSLAKTVEPVDPNQLRLFQE